MSEEHHKKKDETVKLEFTKVRLWQGISLVLLVVIGFMWFNGPVETTGSAAAPAPTAAAPSPSPSPTPTQPTRLDVDVDDDAIKGDPNAPVTIVEFSDFQCPFCSRFYSQTLPQLEENYIKTGKVKLVYRDFPLSFHPEAGPAAEAAECARDQGGDEVYFQYHDALFEGIQLLSSDFYKQVAADLGLDAAEFDSCMESGKFAEEVQADFRAGGQYGVTGTPSFFINGVKLVGAQPYANFEQIIEAELAKE